MGTRSLTVINDEEGTEICVLYRQMDGYPTGHGKELVEFLKPIKMVNGRMPGKTANGMSCLAAQIIAHFKTEPGEFYLYPAGTRDYSEEWIYTVSVKKEQLHLIIAEAGANKPFWQGLIRSYNVDRIQRLYGNLNAA